MHYASNMALNVSTVRRVTVTLSATLYLASFFLPAILFSSVTRHGNNYVPSGNMQVYYGSNMAMVSVFGPLSFNFAGFANPLWIVGCAMLLAKRVRAARLCFFLAACLALQTFQLRFDPLPYDEGEVVQGLLVHLLIGWYAWFTALVLPLLVSFLPIAGTMPLREPRVSAALPT